MKLLSFTKTLMGAFYSEIWSKTSAGRVWFSVALYVEPPCYSGVPLHFSGSAVRFHIFFKDTLHNQKKNKVVLMHLRLKLFAVITYYCVSQYKILPRTNIPFPNVLEFLWKTREDDDEKIMRSSANTFECCFTYISGLRRNMLSLHVCNWEEIHTS